MVERGDVVLVNKPEFNMNNVECSVSQTMIDDPHARQYYGEDCIVVKYKGNQIAVGKDEYELKNRPEPSHDNVIEIVSPEVKKFDVITLNKRDKGTQKLFYQVVDKHVSGVSFIDDLGNKRTYPDSDYKVVDSSNWFEYIDHLQQESYNLKKFVTETARLFKDDISHMLDKLD